MSDDDFAMNFRKRAPGRHLKKPRYAIPFYRMMMDCGGCGIKTPYKLCSGHGLDGKYYCPKCSERIQKMSNFREALEGLINEHSLENGSDTPDFILAEFLTDSLAAFDKATQTRAGWHHRGKEKNSDCWKGEPVVEMEAHMDVDLSGVDPETGRQSNINSVRRVNKK